MWTDEKESEIGYRARSRDVKQNKILKGINDKGSVRKELPKDQGIIKEGSGMD